MTFVYGLFMALYRALLRLYPAHFRAMFAEEMTAVAALVVQDAKRRGWIVLMRVCLCECAALLLGALRERLVEQREVAAHKLVRARWLARGMALLYVGFWASLVLLNEDVRAAQAPLVAGIVGLVAIGLLLSQHFARMAGWLVILAGVVLVGAMVQSRNLQSIDPFIFLIGLPFIVAGAILIACGGLRNEPPANATGTSMVAISAACGVAARGTAQTTTGTDRNSRRRR